MTHALAVLTRELCMRSAGELLLHRPLLPGRSEPQQLELIAQLLGAPNANIWPSLPELLARVPENFALPSQPYGRNQSFSTLPDYLYASLLPIRCTCTVYMCNCAFGSLQV